MALLFMDGFNHIEDGYDTVKWNTNAGTYTSGYGRLSDWGLSLGYTSKMSKTLGSNYATLVVGAAINTGGNASFSILRFFDSATVQVAIRVTTDGTVSAYRADSTLLGSSSSGACPLSTWTFLEAKVTFNGTTGSVEVKVDGTQVLNLTNQDTTQTANNYANVVEFQGPSISPTTYIDDVYMCDTSGGVNDDFLGDVHVTTLYPTSDGTNTDFTPSTGSDHYALVDDPQLSGTTDYNESSTVSHKDTYGMTTFSGTNTVYGVQICGAVLNPDVGSMNVRTLMISGATPTETEGSDVALSQTMKGAISIYDQEPIDTVSWTAAKVNAAEFGIKLQS